MRGLLTCVFVMMLLVPGGNGEAVGTDPKRPESAPGVRGGGQACEAAGIGMTNPAATYCKRLGYEYEIVEGRDGQLGMCKLPDGEACEAWSFLEGRCGAKHTYCAINGYGIRTAPAGSGSLSSRHAVCIDDEGHEVGSVSTMLGLTELATRGRMVVEDDERAVVSKTPPGLLKAVPSSFDWRNHDSHNWLTNVKDQGSCGSCWSFSAIGVVEAVYNIATDDPGFDLDLSEQFLVSNCFENNTCCGGWHNKALDYIKASGVTDEACFPYGDGGCQAKCFIGMVVQRLPLADPQRTLDVLRGFRDRFVNAETQNAYYEFARDVRDILLSNPKLLFDGGLLFVEYMPAIEQLVDAENGRGILVESTDVERVTTFLDALQSEVTARREVMGWARAFELNQYLDEMRWQVSVALGRDFGEAFVDSVYARQESLFGEYSPEASLKCDCNCKYSSGTDGKICSDRTCSDRCSDWASRLWKIVTRHGVPSNAASMKQYLVTYGPLGVALGIGDTFKGYWDNGLYRCGKEKVCEGNECIYANHAVILVGYNDAGGYWIIRNSWGGGWHDGGYYKLAYDECSVHKYVHAVDVNHPPEADAGGPYSSTEGAAVLFDGSGSSDPDGDSLEYRWDFDNNGSWDTSWSSSSTASKTWADDHSGSVKLEVSDGRLTDSDTASVRVFNVAPTVTATGDSIFEGQTATIAASWTDPGVPDWHTATVSWGDGTPLQLVAVNQGAGWGNLTASHAFGDDGSYVVTVSVTDDDGGVGTAVTGVQVTNLDPAVELDRTGTILFAGGEVFVGRLGEPQTHAATASDPGSDDLDFSWSFGAQTMYYNNGVGPDPLPSPWGVYPFTATDSADVTFTSAGAKVIGVTVVDDDQGQASAELGKLVTGDCTCTWSQGFWKHQFQKDVDQHIDLVTLAAYLEVVNYASAVFSEVVPAATLAEARAVMWFQTPGMSFKARAQALAAWLNAAHGCVLWSEMIDTDRDLVPDTPFLDVMTQVEAILADPASDHAALVLAKDLAEAVNLHDAFNPECVD